MLIFGIGLIGGHAVKKINVVIIMIIVIVLIFIREIDTLLFGQFNSSHFFPNERFEITGLTYNIYALFIYLLGFFMAKNIPTINIILPNLTNIVIILILLFASNILIISFILPITSSLMIILGNPDANIFLRIVTGYYIGMATSRHRLV